MKSLAKAVMLILLLFNAGVLISSADSPPPLPNTFSGTIKFANSSGQFDVPAGTVIEALIENVTKGSTTVIEAGKYRIDVSGSYDDDGKRFHSIFAKSIGIKHLLFTRDFVFDLKRILFLECWNCEVLF
ncbi:MAG: hypothetical protein L6263_12650, partial [Desulfobacteraceae bacterium]|nr:hypothetical protein [Desulfobacteraceae bacterium]